MFNLSDTWTPQLYLGIYLMKITRFFFFYVLFTNNTHKACTLGFCSGGKQSKALWQTVKTHFKLDQSGSPEPFFLWFFCKKSENGRTLDPDRFQCFAVSFVKSKSDNTDTQTLLWDDTGGRWFLKFGQSEVALAHLLTYAVCILHTCSLLLWQPDSHLLRKKLWKIRAELISLPAVAELQHAKAEKLK